MIGRPRRRPQTLVPVIANKLSILPALRVYARLIGNRNVLLRSKSAVWSLCWSCSGRDVRLWSLDGFVVCSRRNRDRSQSGESGHCSDQCSAHRLLRLSSDSRTTAPAQAPPKYYRRNHCIDGKIHTSGTRHFRPHGCRCRGLVCHKHHPADTKFIGDHSEFGREESLGERHGYLAALCQAVEKLVGLRLGLGGD